MCQKMFLNTLGISERAVEFALDNGGNNIIADDKRGKHAPKHKISDVGKKLSTTTLWHSILPSHIIDGSMHLDGCTFHQKLMQWKCITIIYSSVLKKIENHIATLCILMLFVRKISALQNCGWRNVRIVKNLRSI